MKIQRQEDWEAKDIQTVAQFITEELEPMANDPSIGQIERVEYRSGNTLDAFGRLVEVLVDRGLLDADDIMQITDRTSRKVVLIPEEESAVEPPQRFADGSSIRYDAETQKWIASRPPGSSSADWGFDTKQYELTEVFSKRVDAILALRRYGWGPKTEDEARRAAPAKPKTPGGRTAERLTDSQIYPLFAALADFASSEGGQLPNEFSGQKEEAYQIIRNWYDNLTTS